MYVLLNRGDNLNMFVDECIISVMTNMFLGIILKKIKFYFLMNCSQDITQLLLTDNTVTSTVCKVLSY